MPSEIRTGSELATFVPFGIPVLIAVTLLLGAAAGAVALSRGRMRRPVTVTAAVIVGVSMIGIVVGNHYGVADKRADTAKPPEHERSSFSARVESAEQRDDHLTVTPRDRG